MNSYPHQHKKGQHHILWDTIIHLHWHHQLVVIAITFACWKYQNLQVLPVMQISLLNLLPNVNHTKSKWFSFTQGLLRFTYILKQTFAKFLIIWTSTAFLFTLSTGTCVQSIEILFYPKEWIRPNSFVFCASGNDVSFSVPISWCLRLALLYFLLLY